MARSTIGLAFAVGIFIHAVQDAGFISSGSRQSISRTSVARLKAAAGEDIDFGDVPAPKSAPEDAVPAPQENPRERRRRCHTGWRIGHWRFGTAWCSFHSRV